MGSTELASWFVNVRRLLESSVSNIDERRGAPAVRLTCDIPAGLPPVKVAPHRLTQALVNLVHNARDAILALRARDPTLPPDRGRITIQACARPDGRAVLVKVIDDGCGMSPEVLRNATDPFFTTKDRPSVAGDPRGGSGMGLSLAYAICQRVGGGLDIESQPGQGTTVTLTLPVVGDDAVELEAVEAIRST